MRNFAAVLVSPFLAVTGYRFNKSWRHADHGFKAMTYRVLSTVMANHYADRLSGVRS